MRYIKTKDGNIYDLNECFSEDFPFDPKHGITYEFRDGVKVNEHDIVAQADTVEELCKIPMTGSEALENIKAIELRHIEQEEDEDIDGEWVYTDHEVYDGTVAENYPDEIEALEKEHKALEILKRTALRLVSLEDDSSLCPEGEYAFYDAELYNYKKLTKEEYELLKEVLR